METLEMMGQRIRLLREEKNIRQKDMAEIIAVTANHYQKIEYGRVNISALTLCQLADYFGVTADYLLGRSEERA